MNLRIIGHKVWDYIFEKSLYISGIALVALSVVDISNLNTSIISGWGIKDFPIGKAFYYLIVGISLIFGIFATQHAQDIADLEKSIKSLEGDAKEKGDKIIDLENSLTEAVSEMNELFNSYIKLLVKNLNFTHNERISVYKVYQDKFILIGRSSVNPTLTKQGRTHFPVTQGFIGKGWAEGEFFVDDLPDKALKSGDTYYNRVNTISPIPRDIIRSMNMISRTYFVYRINGYDNEPKAVVVVESQEHKAFKKEDVIEKLAGVKQPLVMFIEKNNGVHSQKANSLNL